MDMTTKKKVNLVQMMMKSQICHHQKSLGCNYMKMVSFLWNKFICLCWLSDQSLHFNSSIADKTRRRKSALSPLLETSVKTIANNSEIDSSLPQKVESTPINVLEEAEKVLLIFTHCFPAFKKIYFDSSENPLEK